MSTFGDMLLRNAIGTHVYNRIPSRLRNLDRLARSLGADVDFDFTSGVLDSRLTYARNDTVGTYFDSAGVLQTASANQPRFDHDPNTLEPLGLLIEDSRENLNTNSNSIAAWTSGTSATQSLDSHVAPDGTTTADTITFIADATSQYYKAFTLTAAAHVISVYARSVSGTKQFRLKYNNGSTDAYSTDLTATTTWQRFTFAITGVAAAGDIGIANASGADAGSIVVWGIQVEVGAFATSYIPTTGSTALSQADALSCTGTNFSSWYRQDAGTVLINMAPLDYVPPNPHYGGVVSFSDGTNNNFIVSWINSTTGNVFELKTGGTGYVTINGAVDNTTLEKWAYAYATNSANAAINGTLKTLDTSVTLGTSIDRMYIGANQTNSGRKRVHIKFVKYWRQRIPDAALQVLTS